jgi:hypothetical protein
MHASARARALLEHHTTRAPRHAVACDAACDGPAGNARGAGGRVQPKATAADRRYSVSFAEAKIGLGLNTDEVGCHALRDCDALRCDVLRCDALRCDAMQASGKIVVGKVSGPSIDAGVRVGDIVVGLGTSGVRRSACAA